MPINKAARNTLCMIASTCLAVVFVPSFFVVVRRFEEWRAARRKRVSPHFAPAE